MDLTCHKCGHTADYLEFPYLCKNGCPACGESDLRRCPECGAECVFSRAESLENEELLLEVLTKRLAEIPRTADQQLRNEARDLLVRLQDMNTRWNIPQLGEFLKKRRRELFY